MTELLLNHLLFFMNNKIHSTDKDKLVEICAKFYTNFDEIHEAKQLLYAQGAGKKPTQRRSDDKVTQSLADIYDVLLAADKDRFALPTFVASDFTRFPQSNDGSVNLEQILLTMNSVNSRLDNLQKNAVTKDMLRSSALNDNHRSDLLGQLTSVSASEATGGAAIVSTAVGGAPLVVTVGGGGGGSGGGGGGDADGGSGGDDGGGDASGSVSMAVRLSASAANRIIPTSNTAQNPKNKVVSMNSRDNSRNRNRQIFIGKKISTGVMSWGGNDILAHRYVGNVRTNVTADTINEDLLSLKIRNVKVEVNVESTHSKSFKVSFNREDAVLVDDASFWPANVIVRRWHNPRPSRPPAAAWRSPSGETNNAIPPTA